MNVNALRLLLLLACTLAWSLCLQASPEGTMKLVWEDNFDGKELDPKKWNTNGVVKVVDGQLSLEATPGDRPMFWRGSGVNTNGKFKTAGFGYVEASILFTKSRDHGGGFSIGNEDMGKPAARMNFGGSGDGAGLGLYIVNDERGRSLSPNENPVPKDSYSKKFHKFGFAWTATDYRWYVDGRLVQKMVQPPTTKPMAISFGHSVGGEAGFTKNFPDPTKGPEPVRVDWVKVYQ